MFDTTLLEDQELIALQNALGASATGVHCGDDDDDEDM